MGKNILEEQANFLSVTNKKLYIAILKIFYANHKFELEFKEGKEANADEIYNFLKEEKEIEDLTKEKVENALTQLCDWKNLESRPNLEVINRWEDFDKKTSLYSMTNASIFFIKALEEFENKEEDNSNLSTGYLDEIVKNLKNLKNVDLNFKNENEIYNAWILLKENYDLLNTRYSDYLIRFAKDNKNDLKYKDLLKYKEDIKLNIIEFVNVLDKKKTEEIYPLIVETEEKFKKYLAPIIAKKNVRDKHLIYDEELEKINTLWYKLRKWFTNEETSKSFRISQYTTKFLGNFFKNINMYYDSYGFDMKKEYSYILKLFASCTSKEEADKLSAYIFGFNNIRHYKMVDEILVSDDIESTYKQESVNFQFYKYQQTERRKNERKGRIEKTQEEKELEKAEILKKIELDNYIENEILKENIDTIDFHNQILKNEVVYVLQDLYYQGFVNEKNEALSDFGKKYKVNILNEKINLICEDGVYEMPRCKFNQIL